MPIYLLPLDLVQGIQVSETQGGTLTLQEIPGFALEIAAGSATFPDGSTSGLVSVTPVHADKVPMVPNFGQQPRFIVTIQPAGVHFDPPAKITLPNVDGLAPGEITELYSFDHDAGRFVSIGPGVVSTDGSVITSEPGVGIIKGGWHCGGNPQVTGCCGQECPKPGECKIQLGTSTCDGCPTENKPICSQCSVGVCNANASCVANNPIGNLDACPLRVDNPETGKELNGCSVPPNLPQFLRDRLAFDDDPMGDGFSSFRSACDFHDVCYGTCSRNPNNKVGVCDTGFLDRMQAVCNASYSPIFDPIDFVDCHAFATGYWGGVRFLGDDAYLNRQRRGCNCC